MSLLLLATVRTLLILVILVYSSNVSFAQVPLEPLTTSVPVRISAKFILDANGSRPGTGNINDPDEINRDVNYANRVLRGEMSELQVNLLEIQEIRGISQYYSVDATDTNRDNLRRDALNNPALYRWRTDAVNIYINGFTGGSGTCAISNFPPNNNIIFFNQDCPFPDTMLHEIGHSINLIHTHENDQCADTIADNPGWNTIDKVAQGNFGTNYANLTEAQQIQVDAVWFNVMSYHPTRNRLTRCQKDRASQQADTDRNWLLSRRPIYVNSGYGGVVQDGTFQAPYKTLQGALNAGNLTDRVLVLQVADYTLTQNDISDRVGIVTRLGPSTVSRNGIALYELRGELENSESPEVRKAIRAVQEEDSLAGEVRREGEAAARVAATAEERATILAATEEKRKQHWNKAINSLLEAEKYAKNDEKIAIQLELAQRYTYAGYYERAIDYYRLVAEGTDQTYLREEALRSADECQKNLKEGPR